MAALPIKNGLNPTRVPLPHTGDPMPAIDFLRELIATQRHRHPEDDEAALLARFSAGEVVDDAGRPLQPGDLLRPGRFINFYRIPAPERPVPGSLRPLFQDANLLVVDKPPFLATLPRGQHITQTALVRARREFGIPQLSPSHRLDRLTRGVLMFTTRPEVRGAYQQLFDSRVPVKIYEALTCLPEQAPFEPLPRFAKWRQWEPPSPERPWVLEHHMIKERGRLSTYLLEPPVAQASGDGQLRGIPSNAETHILGLRREQRLISPGGGAEPRPREVLVWRLAPHTGKTHQLRVVLRSLGLPILHDPLYEELSDAALTDVTAPLPKPPFTGEEDFTRPMELTAKELLFPDPLIGENRRFLSEY